MDYIGLKQIQIDKMKNQEQTRSSTGTASDHFTRITESMKKKFFIRQFFFTFYHVTRIALTITIIVLISQTDLKTTKQNQSYLRVQEVLQLWQKYVIVDITTVSTYNCPRDYQPYTSAQWEGTKEGCLCQTSLNSYDYIHVLPGQCSLKLINVGCTRINPQKSLPFFFWKTQKLICVKRIKGLNFYTNLGSYLSSEKLKKCSKSLNYQIQSLVAQKCPVTALSNISSTYQNILSEIQFSFARESTYPIIDIKMSEYSFCAEYNRANISPNRFQNYDLQNVQITNCLDDNDPRVKEVDQITQKLLFQNNQRIHDIITYILPVYPRPMDKYVYKLGTVEYPPWTLACRQSTQYNLTKVKNNFEFNDSIQKSQTCVGLTAAMVGIWGFIYSIICVIRRIVDIRYKQKHGILWYPDATVIRIDPNLYSKPNMFCETFLFIFLILLALGLLIQLGVQYEYVNLMELWMRTSYDCMDNTPYFQNWVTDAYVIALQNCIRTYLICILAAVVGVCLDIVYTVWRFNRGDLMHQSLQQIFGINEQLQRNSDQNIKVDDEKENEIVKDDIIDNQFQKEYGQYGQQRSQHSKNALKDRKKTGDVDLELIDFEESEVGPQIKSRKPKSKISGARRNSVRMKQKGVNNPTEQSLVLGEDDMEFKNLDFDEPPLQKSRKLPKEKKQVPKTFEMDD